jgi:hypothetical protein
VTLLNEERSHWFPLSYRNAGMDRLTFWLDTLVGSGPGRAGVEVTDTALRVRMAEFRMDIPRDAVRSVHRSNARLYGTSGVHASRGRLLVNGCAEGLVELALDPPLRTPRTLSTAFLRERVSTLILSLTEPDTFIAAVRRR